jgi:hypothetical protein
MRDHGPKLWLGGAIWLAFAVALGLVAHAQATEHGPSLGKLTRYLFTGAETRQLQLAGPLRVGDPVLDSERFFLGRVVGIVGDDGPAPSTRALPRSDRYTVILQFDPEVHVSPTATFRTSTAPVDAQWVLSTLLPEDKRDFVTAELRAFADAHSDAIGAVLRPVAEDVIEHAMTLMEANLRLALKRNEGKVQALLDKHRLMVKDDLLPVLKTELGPSAKAKAQPILNEIGRELWDQLPMWSVSWRLLADTIPGTKKTRTEEWWKEFVDETAIPIVAKHEGKLIKALEELIEEGSRNPEVRKALGAATRRLAEDPQFKQLVRTLIEEALVKPFDAGALVGKVWDDPAHRKRLRELQHAFGPTLKRIARRLTTDPETGAIDPDLARVLRRVVFRKDGRWVELDLEVPKDAPGTPGEPLRKF